MISRKNTTVSAPDGHARPANRPIRSRSHFRAIVQPIQFAELEEPLRRALAMELSGHQFVLFSRSRSRRGFLTGTNFEYAPTFTSRDLPAGQRKLTLSAKNLKAVKILLNDPQARRGPRGKIPKLVWHLEKSEGNRAGCRHAVP